MKRILLAGLLLLAFVGSRPASAQGEQKTAQPITDRLYPLVPLEQYPGAQSFIAPQGLACGQYFYMNNKANKGVSGKYSSVYFASPNNGHYIIWAPAWNKILVITDGRKEVPTVDYHRPSDFYDFMIIRISQADLAKAQPCLPPPIKK